MEKVTRDNIEDHLFNRMLEVIGKTKVQLIDTYKYRFDFTMTREQYIDYQKYCIKLIMKILRVSKTKATVAFERFWIDYGIRLKG